MSKYCNFLHKVCIDYDEDVRSIKQTVIINISDFGMSVSVCMATFNGLEWVEQQINSILKQTVKASELIIVDDLSSDGTYEFLQELDKTEIKLYRNDKNLGVVKSFEKAFMEASGDVVFLCDQDDVWHEDKIEKVLENFHQNPKSLIVVHDAILIDSQNKSLEQTFYSTRQFSDSLVKNLYKNRFHGCCMAVKREFLDLCIPFPEKTPIHDWWIGILACRKGKVSFLAETLIGYRKHENNLTGEPGSFLEQLNWRIVILLGLWKY